MVCVKTFFLSLFACLKVHFIQFLKQEQLFLKLQFGITCTSFVCVSLFSFPRCHRTRHTLQSFEKIEKLSFQVYPLIHMFSISKQENVMFRVNLRPLFSCDNSLNFRKALPENRASR